MCKKKQKQEQTKSHSEKLYVVRLDRESAPNAQVQSDI